MELIDVSWPLTPHTTGYKNKSAVAVHEAKTWEADGVRESVVTLNCHAGTHLDAPAHFMADGGTMSTLALEKCISLAMVIDATAVTECITEQFLQEHEHELIYDAFVLFKTRNSQQLPTAPFDQSFVYLDASAAHYLVSKKVRGVGIDYLGIERNQPDHPTHTILMSAGVMILEGLRLQSVRAGAYTLSCLPIFLPGTEAAPVRAVLIAS